MKMSLLTNNVYQTLMITFYMSIINESQSNKIKQKNRELSQVLALILPRNRDDMGQSQEP